MIKKRNWACVIYPESAPEDWIDQFVIKGLCFAVSPLHDKDLDPTGLPKKPHYHVILSFSGPTTDKTVNDLLKSFNQPIAIPLESVTGYYRYFTHKDNPDKFQYNQKDIRLYNGFDISDILNSFEVTECIKSILLIIVEQGITEYYDLLNFLLSTDNIELLNVATSHTILFNTYITSKRHGNNKLKNEIK